MRDGYISKEYIINKCKEHRDFIISAWGSFADLPKEEKYACDAYGTCWADVVNADPVDILPVNEVADHIKNRLYETALNTEDKVSSDTIVDMAERIDLWVDELKPNPDQNQWMSTDTLPPQAQQVIAKAEALESVLEECRRKLVYLLNRTIEDPTTRADVRKLIGKIDGLLCTSDE